MAVYKQPERDKTAITDFSIAEAGGKELKSHLQIC